jgi:hypothetical protein
MADLRVVSASELSDEEEQDEQCVAETTVSKPTQQERSRREGCDVEDVKAKCNKANFENVQMHIGPMKMKDLSKKVRELRGCQVNDGTACPVFKHLREEGSLSVGKEEEKSSEEKGEQSETQEVARSDQGNLSEGQEAVHS